MVREFEQDMNALSSRSLRFLNTDFDRLLLYTNEGSQAKSVYAVSSASNASPATCQLIDGRMYSTDAI